MRDPTKILFEIAHHINLTYPDLTSVFQQTHNLRTIAQAKGIEVFSNSEYFDFKKGIQVIRISQKHVIYSLDIVNSFDYYFSAVKPLLLDNLELVDYSTPRYHEVSGFDLMPVFFHRFRSQLKPPISI